MPYHPPSGRRDCRHCGKAFKPLGHTTRWCSIECRIALNTKPGKNGCIEWTASKQIGGYGDIRLHGRKNSKRVTHIVWEMANGQIPDGLVIRHRCDNPPCVNLDHLEVGTRAENNHDMKVRKRWRNAGHKGEQIGTSTLTAADVRKIRQRTKRGEDQKTIGADFGISQAHVSRIHCRQSWKHLSEID